MFNENSAENSSPIFELNKPKEKKQKKQKKCTSKNNYPSNLENNYSNEENITSQKLSLNNNNCNVLIIKFI